MNYLHVTEKLEVNASIFKSLLANVSEEQARWKPVSDKWSLLEVINHLHDEEREDFRQRLQLVLSNPDSPWPAIAPEKWVVEREYNNRELRISLNNFLAERKKSVAWLKELTRPNWQAAYHHPKLGSMNAEQLLLNWLAHDYLHIRQMTFLQWSYLSAQSPSIDLKYAGERQKQMTKKIYS